MFDRASPSGDSGVKIDIESCDEKECKRNDEDEKDKDSLEGQEKGKESSRAEAETRAVLMPRPWIDNPRVKRSESLNKPEKPEVFIKVRRSESLGKADIRRTDLLTKNEKTETNMKVRENNFSSLIFTQFFNKKKRESFFWLVKLNIFKTIEGKKGKKMKQKNHWKKGKEGIKKKIFEKRATNEEEKL